MNPTHPSPSKAYSEEDIHKLIFQHLDEPPDMIDLQKAIIQWAVDLLEATAGEIFLWDPAREALVLTLPTGYTQRYSDRFEGVALKSGEGLAGRAFQSMQPMIVKDYRDWEGRSPIFMDGDEFLLHSVLAVPMIWQGKPIGVLTINASIDQKTFGDADIRLATLFSNIAAVSIMNARLYGLLQVQTRSIKDALQQEVTTRTAELQRHNLQLNLSAQVSREITSIFNLDQLLTQVVNRVRSAFGYYCVLVYLADTQNSQLILKAASGEIGEKMLQLGKKVAIDRTSPNGRSADSHQRVIVNDIAQSGDFQADKLLPLTRSELVLPLQVGSHLLGTLDVQSSEVDTFNEQEVLILQSLGDQVAIAIQNSYFYERSKEIAVLEERNRLARELHDSVTQSLFSMDLHARAIATYIEKDIVKAKEQIQALRQTAHDTLQDMRSLIYDLRPISLKEIGLYNAIKEQVERIQNESTRIILEFNCNQSLPDAVESCLFRIAQEALRNAVKHSSANQIDCSINCTDNQIRLVVRDNGRGFNPQDATAKRQSFGILGMRERTELLQGRFFIESSVGNGTCISVELPI